MTLYPLTTRRPTRSGARPTAASSRRSSSIRPGDDQLPTRGDRSCHATRRSPRWKRRACRCSCMAKLPIRRSTSSTARTSLSKRCCSPAGTAAGLRVVFEHHDGRCRRVRRSGGRERRCDDHRTSSALQPQRAVHRVVFVRTITALPVLKREKHRAALNDAATSGSRKFFLALIRRRTRATIGHEAPCGCAGCYTAHAALELYTEVSEAADALDRLEAFASFNGPDFYRLPRNETHVTLEKKRPWQVPGGVCIRRRRVAGAPSAGESPTWRPVG